MAEPVHRFTFAKTSVQTQADVINGVPLFFVDITQPPESQDLPDVAIGWSADRERFGVFVNGQQVWPPETDDLPTEVHPDDLLEG